MSVKNVVVRGRDGKVLLDFNPRVFAASSALIPVPEFSTVPRAPSALESGTLSS